LKAPGFNPQTYKVISWLHYVAAPCTVIIQRVFFGEKLPSPAVSVALAILLSGIGAATVSDVQLNPLVRGWLLLLHSTPNAPDLVLVFLHNNDVI
jgi:hypothetical protein